MRKVVRIKDNNLIIFDKLVFNIKHLFIVFLLVITTFTFFITDSYSLFTKSDSLTNINFVAGSLNYKLESSILENNKVKIDADNEFKLTITLTSLNDINTKYELYYLVNGEKKEIDGLVVGYTDESVDSISGTIGANETKTITVNVTNFTSETLEIEFGCEGGFISNTLVMSKGLEIVKTVDVNNAVMAFTYLGEEEEPSKFPEKSDGYYVESLTCTGGEAVWNNDTWAMEVISTSGETLKCVAEITDKYNDKSGANQPILGSGMIPVIYDNETSSWIKADVKDKWYNYNEKMWANAVTVKEEKREEYVMADNGTSISIDDINTMWVWIPRYEYKNITSSVGTEISINFLTGTETNNSSGYITHPAFVFDENITGLWVGKFETSSNQTCYANYASIDNGCDLTSLSPTIIPNVTSWRGIRTSTAFIVSKNMKNTGNIYGFNSNEIDTHMMKNTEWGVVAYLSQSKYGRCLDGICDEIMLNNNTDYITGIAADDQITGGSSSVTNKYNTEKGVLASTTVNIYGIYDMSGGSYEYVMGVMKDNTENSTPMSGFSTGSNSGFSSVIYDEGKYTLYSGSSRSFPDSKYFNLYNFSTDNNTEESYNRYITGDATKETLRWNNDNADFINYENPWFHRGGTYYDYGGAGIFSFNRDNGQANGMVSFRIVLVVK